MIVIIGGQRGATVFITGRPTSPQPVSKVAVGFRLEHKAVGRAGAITSIQLFARARQTRAAAEKDDHDDDDDLMMSGADNI